MERLTQTEVKNLLPGDRFYKASDKSKTVLEIVPEKVKRTQYQTYTVFAKRDNQMHPDPMKSNTQVVFLRHADSAVIK